jgi:hypothetical protein
MSDRKFEKFEGEAITDEMFKAAGKLFSNNYGVWGPLAESKMGDAMKRGE